MAPTKILVVDESQAVRGVVTQMLSRLGHEVSTADSGKNGLSLFLNSSFDIVLSDYEMPGMNGVALACHIKQSGSRVPVVIMTGSGKESMIYRKFKSVDEVIAKPFSLDELDAMIRNLQEKKFGPTPDAAVG